MIFSAPADTSTDTVRSFPITMMDPAGITRSLTSPAGVLITTAERFPMRALAMGTIFFVSSGESSNTVAIPYGLDNCDTTCPGSTTSTAESIPIGILSIYATSSTIGIL